MSFIQFDYQVFQSINNLAVKFTFLNPFMRFFALDAEYIFYVGIVIYWFTRTKQNRRMVAEALISACVGLGISGILANLFYRDRPFVAHSVNQLVQHAANASFPSDHAIGAFVIATAIWLFRKRDGSFWLFLSLCIGFSRIWTGIHYPADIIAGAFIGMLTALGIHYLFAKWAFGRHLLQSAIELYEKAEQKVWVKKTKRDSSY
jgi:undecaprenyl-diphosphatase